MDEASVKMTLAALISKVQALETENARLTELNTACGTTVRRLLDRIENTQSIVDDLRIKTVPGAATNHAYRKRPAVMRGRTVQSNVGCGPLYITLNEDDAGRPFEVFFKLGKSGSCQQSYLEALGVAMSVGLRYGADPQKFIDKFEGMRCPNPKMRNADGPTTLSCADGISQGLAKALALALPGTEPEGRHEAGVIAVAEPQFPLPIEDARDNEANAKSIDLIGHNGTTEYNGGGAINLKKAMQTGVGMCPKCSGPLISQGGCIQCLQQCGYVGKCS